MLKKKVLVAFVIIFRPRILATLSFITRHIVSGHMSHKVISMNQVVQFGSKSKSPCLYGTCVSMWEIDIWCVIKIMWRARIKYVKGTMGIVV